MDMAGAVNNSARAAWPTRSSPSGSSTRGESRHSRPRATRSSADSIDQPGRRPNRDQQRQWGRDSRQANPPGDRGQVGRGRTLNDLGSNDAPADKGGTTTVVVTRASAKQNYTVPVESKNEALAGAQ